MSDFPSHLTPLVAPDHSWAMVVQSPSIALSPYVREISGYVEYASNIAAQRQLPTSFIPMILVLGPGFDVAQAQGQQTYRQLGTSFVAGLQSTAVTMQSVGYVTCMQVNFTLLGARQFLGIDMSDVTGGIVQLSDLVGVRAKRLEDCLRGCNDWTGRFARLEQALTDSLLTKSRARSRANTSLAQAVSAIDANAAGTVSIASLARSLRVSRKHLVTLFHREVGVSPQQYVQLRRFESALEHLGQEQNVSLAEVAHANGYSDQAHFSRHFRRYVGTTPSAYLDELAQNNSD